MKEKRNVPIAVRICENPKSMGLGFWEWEEVRYGGGGR